MGKSTKQHREKPDRPTNDFPLFPHNAEQWAKKVKGRMRYYGLWDDPVAALTEYKRCLPFHSQGMEAPDREQQAGVSLGRMCNEYLSELTELCEAEGIRKCPPSRQCPRTRPSPPARIETQVQPKESRAAPTSTCRRTRQIGRR